MIQGCHRQSGLAEFQQGFLQLLIFRYHATNTSTAGRVSFGNGINNDQILINVIKATHARNNAAVNIAEFTINLVTNQEQIMFLRYIRNQSHFLLRQNCACGIAGIGYHKRPGVGVDQLFKCIPVCVGISILRPCGKRTDPAPCGIDKCVIVRIIGLRNNHLATCIQNTHTGKQQSLTATGGNENLISSQLHPQFCIILTNCFDQNRSSGRCVVCQGGLIKTANSLKIRFGSGNVRLTDI